MALAMGCEASSEVARPPACWFAPAAGLPGPSLPLVQPRSAVCAAGTHHPPRTPCLWSRWRCSRRRMAGCWYGTPPVGRAWCPPRTSTWMCCTSRQVPAACCVRPAQACKCWAWMWPGNADDSSCLPRSSCARCRWGRLAEAAEPSCLLPCLPAEPAVGCGGRGGGRGGRVPAQGGGHAHAGAPARRLHRLWPEQGGPAGQHIQLLPRWAVGTAVRAGTQGPRWRT